MARRRLRFAAVPSIVLVLVFYLLLSFSAADPSPILRPPHNQPLVLPLVLSPRLNSSRIVSGDGDKLRRHLQGAPYLAPNARMGLYDDLLANGYYTTRLWIGTPPQEFALIVDTGSTVTYVPCASCEQCGKHQDPKFQPDLSSTYHPVKCNPDCTCDAENVQCTYERQYAEMSSSSGVLGEDILSFGNLSQLKPQRALFGCENAETGDLYSQHADGIMGLGRGDLSIVDQLVNKGVINDSFSLCYGGMDVGGGAMVLGQISPPSGMVFSNSDPERSPYYNIELKEMHVAGKKLPINPSVFDGKHGTVLDSGTTYAYLPEAAFVAFKHAIMKELHGLKQIRGPDPSYNDICFSGAESPPAFFSRVSELSKIFPAVDMVFGNGQNYSMSPENYLFRHSKVPGAYCLGIFQNGKDPTTLLGGIIVRNTLVTYDRENSKVGFWKTNCSELWDRLHISDASSAIPPSSGEVSTAGISPVSAPNESPHFVIPGDLQVGFITFDMSLSVNTSDIEPRISDLSGSIAQELGVNSSQVRLLNLTSTGNGSLIRWAIYPEPSAQYFSQATAKHIIARVTEHSVQLPETFGNYQLVKWNVQPPMKRSWWQGHYLAVVMAVIVVVMLGSSAYAIWFVRKWRQQTNIPYKPVDSEAVFSEQELQPIVN